MATFQIEIPYDSKDPNEQWNEAARLLSDAFYACEDAEVVFNRMPAPDLRVFIEVRLGVSCDPIHMRLALNTPPWRFDP